MPGVIVPPEAVQGNGDARAVFVINGGRLARQSVRLGARTAEGQTILAGLSAGSSVVVGDLEKLTGGIRVHVIP